MVRCCISFLLLLSLTAYGQNINGQKGFEQQYLYAERLYHSENATAITDSMAIAAYLQVIVQIENKHSHDAMLVDCYLKCGILQMSGVDPGHALIFFHQAIIAASKANQFPDSLLFKPYLYAGSVHYSLNNLDSAVYYYKKAETVNNRYGQLEESERLFNKFGALYYETGDYKKSIAYFQKALSLIENKKPVNIYFIVNYKNNIAAALLKLGDYKQALEIFKSLLSYHTADEELFYNISNTQIQAGNYNEALVYLRRIRKMGSEKYNSYAKAFIALKQYDSARLYLAKALHAFTGKANEKNQQDYGITLKYTGDLQVAEAKTSEGIFSYQQAIMQFDPAFKDSAVSSNPPAFNGLRRFDLLFDALVAKAGALHSLHNSYDLEQSLRAYTSALLLAKYIEHSYFSDDARLFLKAKVTPATQSAVDVALDLFKSSGDRQYINIAFSFAENNKASVLRAGLQNLELTAIPGLPANLVEAERKYKLMIARLTIQSGRINDSASLVRLRQTIGDQQIALSAVQEKLNENASYHQLKFNDGSINIETIRQTKIGKEDAVLCYYYTLTKLVCFYITQETSGFSSVALQDTLFAVIKGLRATLQNPRASGRKVLQDAGTALFEQLILPVFENIKSKKHLTVIPYNEISYIPFEMMYDKRDGQLMLQKFAISYNYATHFLSEPQRVIGSDYRVLSMAPFADKSNTDTGLPILPFSRDEIIDLPGDKLFGLKATKTQFTGLSGAFPIIHLATHAVANDSNLLGSYIEFYGLKNDPDSLHRLYEQEIYNLDMKSARLVILSACETGNGLLINGEGVMSLSRAFAYAGCKTAITSLWQADDRATAFIMKRLHVYLQKGDRGNIALQKAKVDYINDNNIEDRFKNPAYWAHLVLIGDHGAVVEESHHLLRLLLLFTAFAVVMFLVFRKKNRA